MIETFIQDNKLYTKRDNLHTWEENYRTIGQDKLEQLKQDRQDLVDLSPLLVMPDGLILGGTMRFIADGQIGRTIEPIEIIDFGEKDGLWYQVVGGVMRVDKKAFSSKYAAMKYVSYKHNNNYGELNMDQVTADMGNPDLAEMDWAGIYQSISEIDSLLNQAESIAPSNPEETEELLSETLNGTTGDAPKPNQNQPATGQTYDSPFLAKCPDCGCEFDPTKHQSNQSRLGKDPVVPAAAPEVPIMTTANCV